MANGKWRRANSIATNGTPHRAANRLGRPVVLRMPVAYPVRTYESLFLAAGCLSCSCLDGPGGSAAAWRGFAPRARARADPARGPRRGAGWPDGRGPARTGVSPETGLPSSWSPAGQNLAWKAAYGGRSSPVVF